MESARPRILVVDDEEAILETMSFTFEDDFEVHTFTNPRAALEQPGRATAPSPWCSRTSACRR